MAQSMAFELPDFTTLVEKHSRAVVNISTKQNDKLPKGFFPEGQLDDENSNEMLDELMRRFFDHKGKGGGFHGQDKETSSLGSGFIVSSDGYVVTNHHVIDGADEIIVKLSDRRELVAKVIGSDKRSDVALLKVEASNLPVLETGSSENLKVGEWVVAIGSPFGFDHSVTAGIVSAKGRSLPSENYVPFIQTDVAINPGNSGGPLFNMKGQVVGINSQIYSRSGGFMGVSFAIPVDVAKRVVEQLKNKGKVSRGWLGVYIQEVTRELALSFGLDNPTGALVVQVMKKGPANGVLKQGDIILEFDGKQVSNSSALPVIVGATAVDKIVNRRSQNQKLRKILILGMEVEELDDVAKKSFDVEGGLLVKRIKSDPALKAGIERGDIILMFNDTKINNVREFEKLSEELISGKSYAVLVLRDGAARFLALKVEEETKK
ncbi:putative periplasmic serine endoprotease DegP-like [Nymphon striatum]|nr:putative periplasmic serine endoprotease DegP-like [Nymphon striatum]